MVSLVTADSLEHLDFPDLHDPWERLKMANIQAMRSALDHMVRQTATDIVRTMKDVPRDGPQLVADLIRLEYTYMQSPPGVEILQGPRHTAFVGGGDCDDLAMAWVSYTRAMGLRTYVVGVGRQEEYGTFLHAVGYDANTGLHYELSDDRRYSRRWSNGTSFAIPDGWYSSFFDPDPCCGGWWVSAGTGKPYLHMETPMYEPDEYLYPAYDDMSGCSYSRGFPEMGKLDSGAVSVGKVSVDDDGDTSFWEDIMDTVIHRGADVAESYFDDGGVTVVVEDGDPGIDRLASYQEQQVGQGIPWGPVLLVGGLAASGILLYVYR